MGVSIVVEVRYDRRANSASIRLKRIAPGEVTRTFPCHPDDVGTMINLKFDNDGRLIAIEVLEASQYLPKDLLDDAHVIG